MREENEYSKEYSDETFFEKIINVAQKAGINVIYAGLLLFYTLKKPLTPLWAKSTIFAALGYFISPIDAIPDLAPVVGYSDDLGVLVLAIAAVSMFIDDDVKRQARNQLKEWFGDYDESSLSDIDNKVNNNR